MQIMKRGWPTGLGEELRGKIHLFVGAGDSFFLTNAVMDAEDFLANASTLPAYGGSVTIGVHDGRGFQHCFSGYAGAGGATGEAEPNSVTRETYVLLHVVARGESKHHHNHHHHHHRRRRRRRRHSRVAV